MIAEGTTLRLVRHGRTEGAVDVLAGRSSAVGLSAEGRRQAERVADWLRRRLGPEGLAAVYTSPVRRARETAQPIAGAFGLDAVPADGLTEIDFGRWEGRSFDDLEGDADWSRWNRFRAGARAPGGETMAEFQARSAAEILRIRERHPAEEVVVVSHAAVLRALACHFLGLSLDLARRLDVGRGRQAELWVGDETARLRSWNVRPCPSTESAERTSASTRSTSTS